MAGAGGLWWGDMGNGHVVHDARLQTNRGKGGILYFMPVTRRNYCRVLRRGLTHSDLPILKKNHSGCQIENWRAEDCNHTEMGAPTLD